MAASMLMVCMLGAFVVDFGMAYVNKNKAQAAADAGALAAGREYAVAKATCSTTTGAGTVVAPAGTQAKAETEANAVRAANMPGSKAGTISAVCEDGAIKV